MLTTGVLFGSRPLTSRIARQKHLFLTGSIQACINELLKLLTDHKALVRQVSSCCFHEGVAEEGTPDQQRKQLQQAMKLAAGRSKDRADLKPAPEALVAFSWLLQACPELTQAAFSVDSSANPMYIVQSGQSFG